MIYNSAEYLAWLAAQEDSLRRGPKGDTGATGPVGAAGAAGVGLPVSGTEGQIAVKVDGTNYNTAWRTAWPVGKVIISTDNTNPATYLGFGTWECVATGNMTLT